MSETIPTTKKRCDYQVPDFIIERVQLVFHLNGKNTQVTCISQVKRNGQHQRPLVLDGEELILHSLKVDSQPYNDYSITDGHLTINTMT
ncbi:MAG: aminopeptidase N, partial [Paraglaciecola sp.]